MTSFLFFDIETTGLLKAKPKEIDFRKPQQFPEIVQMSWQLYHYDNKTFVHVETKNYIIKPENYCIPEDSIRIHGITNEKAIEEGVDKKLVLQDFYRALMANTKTHMVCHNIEFDVTIVFFHLYTLFKGVFSQYIYTKLPCICTMLDTIELCKIPMKNNLWHRKKISTPYDLYKFPKLSELYFQLFKKPLEGKLHDSSFDVTTLVECFKKLVVDNCDINIRYVAFLIE